MARHALRWTWALAGCLIAAICLADPGADAQDAEIHALQAQIAQMDTQVRDLSNRLHAIGPGAPADDPDVVAMRNQIRDISRDQAFLEARLRQLQASPAASPSPPPPAAATAAAPHIPQTPPPAPPASPAPPAPTAEAPPPAPTLRQAADPAPYLKAAGDAVGMFFYNNYKLIPVGTHQLVVWTSFDQAYLLDLQDACPALLTARKITIENFSTRVVAGRHAVVADGTRCLIVGIRTLHASRLR